MLLKIKKNYFIIIITFLSVTFIFYDSVKLGNILGDVLGFITALGLAINANLARYAKNRDLVPAAVIGKLGTAAFAFIFVNNINLVNTDIIIVPLMCVLCVGLKGIWRIDKSG